MKYLRFFKPQMHFNVISNLATMKLSLLAITNIAFLYNYMLGSSSEYIKEYIKALKCNKNASNSGFHNKLSLLVMHYVKKGTLKKKKKK